VRRGGEHLLQPPKDAAPPGDKVCHKKFASGAQYAVDLHEEARNRGVAVRTLDVKNEIEGLGVERKTLGVALAVFKWSGRTIASSSESCRGGRNVEPDQPPGSQPTGEVSRPTATAATNLEYVEAGPGGTPRARGHNPHVKLQGQVLLHRSIDRGPPILTRQKPHSRVHRRPVGLRVSARQVLVQQPHRQSLQSAEGRAAACRTGDVAPRVQGVRSDRDEPPEDSLTDRRDWAKRGCHGDNRLP
jgi:hypothetical protein